MAKFIILLLFSPVILSAEQSLNGIIDSRFVAVSDDQESYLNGGYGKFSYDSNAQLALAQLGLQYSAQWENNISVHVIGNAFSDGSYNGIGLTEVFLSYKGLPSEGGWRLKSKAGVFYPKISLENIATAWSTPYTLTSSSLNNWIGEELRHTGFELSLNKLGKFSNSQHNFNLDLAFFKNNDTAGALLSWHGWTIGSRQTLLNEKLIVQPFAARETALSAQAGKSDPFLELDNRWGRHLAGSWQYRTLQFSVGIYDNNADPSIVKAGQYTWDTNFLHFGFKYKLNKQTQLISQYMNGSTFMQSPYGNKVVDNDFSNGYIMLSHFWNEHQIAMRAEEFNVTDLDSTWGDNNQEYGKGLSLSYRYKLNKRSFIQTELNWLQSKRPSRWYLKQEINLTEHQFQVAFRHYFNL
ncbi:hypothetical protein [Pseudoalteromonas denitrificans]|uniref:Porin n=1 Tax=Pseudoalteromonas denitrificans DSM 6059 TaxID=1123010 RepID=A0A1I1FKM2_9GAMM|nr:hypothetical protein [Pseudoalteromonas denitrificans]SFB99536.1 hypothetical protein SAMN02745724_00665 [Pseudoalteromonas denitrificans DSM 6059]